MLTKDVVLNILLTMADGSPGWTDWLERAADRIMAAGRAGGVAPSDATTDEDEAGLTGGDDPLDRIGLRVRCLELAVGVKTTPNGCEVDVISLAETFENYLLGVPPAPKVRAGIGGRRA